MMYKYEVHHINCSTNNSPLKLYECKNKTGDIDTEYVKMTGVTILRISLFRAGLCSSEWVPEDFFAVVY